MTYGVRWMALRWQALAIDLALIVSTIMVAHNHVTQGPEIPVPFSSLHQHQACKWYTDILTSKWYAHKIKSTYNKQLKIKCDLYLGPGEGKQSITHNRSLENLHWLMSVEPMLQEHKKHFLYTNVWNLNTALIGCFSAWHKQELSGKKEL